MEECDSLGTQSLKPHIENFLEGIRSWTWFELLEALKQCQESLPSKGYLEILDRIVDELIERLASPCNVTSPYTCSSSRSSFQFSCDTSINNRFEATWWFEHLLFLKIDLLDNIIRKMISYDFDHSVISKFLFYYHNLSYVSAAQDVKIETIKVVINLLSLLDIRSISCKDLFNLNRIAISLKISKFCRNNIECLIGPLLDQVTIDYLLVPSPHDRDHAYDVDFVLRVMKIFLLGGSFELNLNQDKRVSKMMDLFLVEVSPDPHLNPCEFEALITVLPDTMRESHDQLYLAMDMYLKVHAGINEEEKMNICCTLNHEKLSQDILRHLTRNLVFPSETKPRSHVTRHSRMKTLLQENDHLKNFFDPVFGLKNFKNTYVKQDVEKIIYADDDQELKKFGDLEGMEGRTRLACVKKSGVHTMMSLPKFCS
ncbi:BTB/POZ domain-containing protein [Trifolium repens]|nr:BTB/POZ domain-containing protein [Trifolium repens]